MTSTTLSRPAAVPAPMSVFERYLTVWIFLCIVAGIALGQLLPGRLLRGRLLRGRYWWQKPAQFHPP